MKCNNNTFHLLISYYIQCASDILPHLALIAILKRRYYLFCFTVQEIKAQRD